MPLARELLLRGEQETVLQVFEDCKRFWKLDRGRLDQWSEDVRAGRLPLFGIVQLTL
jgi:hypothetical protein